MDNLSLTACSFYFRKSHKKKKNVFYDLNSAMDTGEGGIQISNAVELFEYFFESHLAPVNADEVGENLKTFYCGYDPSQRGETEDYSYLYAVIKSGSYGSSAEIRDIVENKIKYTLKPNDVPERPFVLFIVIPKDSARVTAQKGMLFFQNVGAHGVKTITTYMMRDFFGKKVKYSMRCGNIAPDLFIKKVISPDNIRKIYMTQNYTSTDSADKMYKGYGVSTTEISKLRFTQSKWKDVMDSIKYASQGKHNLFEFDGDDFDGAKVVVSIGGRERKVDLHNLENLSIIEGIPSDVMKSDGHPDLERLLTHFHKVAYEYLSELVVQIDK